MRLAAILMVLGLSGAPLARADLEKGDYAPDIEAKDWINAEELPQPVSLKDLRGMIVVLFFWESSNRAGEFLMQSVNIVHNHRVLAREYGVMVVGVTEASRSMVWDTLKKQKANFPVALESTSYKEYKIEQLPRVVVIDPDGKVVLSASALSDGSDVQRAIFDTLTENPPSRTRPGEAAIVYRRLDEARNALRDRSYRHAFEAARNAYEHAVRGDPLKTRCQDMLGLLDMVARDRLAEVDELIDERKFAEALDAIRWVMRNFYGADVARDARKRMETLKKQYAEVADLLKGRQTTLAAAKLLKEARRHLVAQRFGPAHEKLKKIVDEHKDTEVGPIAESILRRMQENPVVAAAVRDHLAGPECRQLMADARNFLASGRRADATARLQQILERYPGTRYAEEAKKMLIELR